MSAVYRLEGVCARYGGRDALTVGSLEIAAAGVTAVVGPNGSGKTTLLRVLAFLLAPAGGRIEFCSQRVEYRERALRQLRREVTFVAQTPFLFHRSVRGNVAYGLARRGPVAPERVARALESVGLAAFGDRAAWKLSGGEAQRVAIARALAIDPRVILFDEPTANVDRGHAPAIESVIAAQKRDGRTIVFTTHNLAQAYRLGDTVISLVGGVVETAPLVNLLRGTAVRAAGGNHYFETGGLRIELPGALFSAAIAVDPSDIIVSRQPLASSARNCFAGCIARVEREARGILLTVDCGARLRARITAHSYEEMGLNVGARVYLTFKSSAIRPLEEHTPRRR